MRTFAPNQNTDGGFGGGHGQLSHLAPSYAVVLSLAMVGGSESLALINRRAMWVQSHSTSPIIAYRWELIRVTTKVEMAQPVKADRWGIQSVRWWGRRCSVWTAFISLMAIAKLGR